MAKKLDLTKPVQTKSGLPARIICTDKKDDEFPVVALVSMSDMEALLKFNRFGAAELGSDGSGFDLVNVPEKKGAWFNIYNTENVIIPKTADAFGYKTREDADAHGNAHRVACVYVEWEESNG